MASGIFANLVSSFGLKSNGMNAIDVINGIPVRITNNNGAATVFVFCGKEKAPSVIGPIRDAAAAAGLKKPSVSGDSIVFGFKKAKMAVPEYEAIRQIVSTNSGFFNIDQCPYCFMGSCDIAGMYGNMSARRMHRQCYLNNRNTQIDKIKSSDGNYVTGIIGAIIAAILVVGLADLLVLGLDRIFYILYLGFPLFIAAGFRMGKGPYGAAGTFCHVTVSVLAMYVYFYIQGCYYASQWYNVTMIQAVPYFGDIMEIITDPEFLKYSALEIILFVVGLLITIFANPTSKLQGTKEVQKNDVFVTPLTTINTGFSGADAYNPYASQTASADPYENKSSFADAFGDQNGFNSSYEGQSQATDAYGYQSGTQGSTDSQNASQQSSSSSWNDVYGSGSDNNNGFGN